MSMQKEISVKEFIGVVNKNDDIETMIVKRENKKDFVLISLEEYKKKLFFSRFERSKAEYRAGKVHNARTVFKELREKYGY